jgi:uncharacterized protein (TIGR03437 family)
VAGTGQTGSEGDNGPGALAALNNPRGVAVDSGGNVYIADTDNSVIRRVDASTGTITLFAGNYTCCYAGTGTGGDGGQATGATLFVPGGVAVDGSGNVYFTDAVENGGKPGLLSGPNGSGQAVRRVTTDGIIHPWAGGTQAGNGFSGDGGPPLQAVFGGQTNLAAASDGSLYIADLNNNRVRKVDPAGATINTVVGNGQSGYAGDGGSATSAAVQGPAGIALDAAGNLYVGAYSYVRKVTPKGIIGPYVDNGQQYGFSGDGGPATAASIELASGLAVDSGDNLYIADVNNLRVRQVQPAVSPAIALSSTYVTFMLAATSSTATNQALVLTNGGKGTLNWASSVTTTSGGDWLSILPSTGSVLAGEAGTKVTVSADPSGLGAGDYYGQIQISSPNAASPVQIITVRLTVQTAGEAPPQVFANGMVSDASYAAGAPSAPGTLVAIFGANFTDSTKSLETSGYPWPYQLGGTSVTIGGEAVPLFLVAAGQINAVLPFDLAVNTKMPIVVKRNNAVSAPEPASLVSSQPGVFTQSSNGQGIGAIEIYLADGSYAGVVGKGNSAAAGDTVVIYCTGLGDVTPRAVAGYPAPPLPLSSTIEAVTVTIGGVNVPVSFAGLAPGETGVYQVNVTIPSGIAANQQAPLVLSQGGRTSATVTIPVQ